MTKLNTNELFAGIVREHRTQAGLSQEELAHQAGLHRTYVSLLERGRRNPSLSVVVALARALGVPVSAFVSGLEGKAHDSGR